MPVTSPQRGSAHDLAHVHCRQQQDPTKRWIGLTVMMWIRTLIPTSHDRREMVDAMQQSSKYSWAYSIGFLYSYVLTMPHSVAVNLAYPDKIPVNDNVYGMSPLTVIFLSLRHYWKR